MPSAFVTYKQTQRSLVYISNARHRDNNFSPFACKIDMRR